MITENDFTEIMNLLLSAYGEKAFPTDNLEKMDKVLHLWTVMFKDDSPEEVLVAVKDCIATLQFPPKIADIKSRIAQSRLAGQPTEMEAWAMVYKAIAEATRIGKAQTLFDELPPIAQELVAMPEQLLDWHEVPGDKLTTVVASNFMRSYKVKAERQASYHALPADIQKHEEWKLPKEKEKPKELPMTQFKYDANGKRILNIGFEPPDFMKTKVQIWMDLGVSDAEIRKGCVNWGTYEPVEIPMPESRAEKEGGIPVEEYCKMRGW